MRRTEGVRGTEEVEQEAPGFQPGEAHFHPKKQTRTNTQGMSPVFNRGIFTSKPADPCERLHSGEVPTELSM
jgi:hypothetical protein